ncbi:MAG: hypothetical protein ACJ789_17265 [Thermomicrobiales bacterium]
MASIAQRTQALPSLRQPASPSIWQRIVAAFKRDRISQSGDTPRALEASEAVGATDRELSLMTKRGPHARVDQRQNDVLIGIYQSGMHS